MKFRWILLSVLIAISCTPSRNNQVDSLLSYVPVKLAALVKTNDFETFKSSLKNNPFLYPLSNQPEFELVREKLKALEYFNFQERVLIAFSNIEKSNLDFILIQKSKLDKGFTKDSIPVKSIPYNGENINQYTLGNTQLYGVHLNSIRLLSSSQLLLENAIRNQGSHPIDMELETLYSLSNQNQLFIPIQSGTWFSDMSLARIAETPIKRMGNWASLEIELNPDSFQLNGVVMVSDSLSQYLNLFKGMRIKEALVPKYAPFSTSKFWSFSLNDYDQFLTNKEYYLHKKTPKDTLFNRVEELALIHFTNEKAVLVRASNADLVFNKISESQSYYQEIKTGNLIQRDLLKNSFEPLINDPSFSQVGFLDDVLIFTKNSEALHALISAINTQATYDTTNAYKSAIPLLAHQASITYLGNSITDLFNFSNTSPSKDKIVAAQWVADRGFYHQHLGIKKIPKSKKESKKMLPLFTVKLDKEIQFGPVYVTNHRSKLKEILVQDTGNTLYLIDHKGSILWKKPLEASIRGTVHQVDIYRNGRLQFAFTTENQFLVVDRNGRTVNDFTLNFKDGNLGPLAVFDYDGSRQYRFVITQGDQVFMLDNKGKRVKGFSFTRAASDIALAPKHFRNKNKDYLVFKLSDGSLKILDRRGKERIDAPENLKLSYNDLYWYENQLSTTNQKGELIQINTDGKIKKTDLKVGPNHKIDATANMLAVIDNNILRIKDNNYTLPFGDYTAPNIMYLKDTIYVSVTNKETHQVYLFNSKAQLLNLFPIYGYSNAQLADMNRDQKIELLTQEGTDGIIVYQLP